MSEKKQIAHGHAHAHGHVGNGNREDEWALSQVNGTGAGMLPPSILKSL